MKHFKHLLPVIILLIISCSTDDSTNLTTATTRLELTTLDENDVAIENVEVKLYASQLDYDNDTNVIETLMTDTNGKVTFDNLQPITYYWKTNIDCYLENNDHNTNSPIISNTLNQYTTNLNSNFIGDFHFINTTPYVYDVYYTGPESGQSIPVGILHVYMIGWPVGVYTFTLIPQSGPNPTITQTVTLDCGGTTIIEIN